LGYKYFVHFSGRRLLADEMKKNGFTQCNDMTILTDSFVPLQFACFVVLTQNRSGGIHVLS